jgi:hypothetical protein
MRLLMVLSRIRRFGATALIAVPMVLASAAWATPRVLGPGTIEDAPAIRVLSNSSRGVDLEFRLPALAIEDVQVAGETFQILAIPHGGENGEVGQPMLPIFSRLLQIPARSGVRVAATVEQADEYDGIRVIPVQDAEGEPFTFDTAAYSREGYGDTPVARSGEPALMRDLRVVPLTFSPVQYDPARGRLRVARLVRVQVDFSGENLVNAGEPQTRPIPASFDRMYQQLVINYDRGGREVRPGTWLVICNDDPTVINDLQPLMTWRRRKGLSTMLATTTETGTTAYLIKSYIGYLYNHSDPPLEYVVLAGDASGTYNIPTWRDPFYNGEGDHPYTQLDGSDMISDVHLGRLSFSSTTNLEQIVSKTVNYESNPYTTDDPGWFTRACLVGDPNSSGYSTVQVMQSIKTQLLQIGYTQIDTVFSGSFVSQMTAALNRGDTIFAYRGYIGMSGWTNSNTDALTNAWKMPFGVMSTCGTGGFASGTCRSEEFLRAWDSTNNRPRGTVGAIGTATSDTHTRFNNCYTYGVIGGLLNEGTYTMGAAHTRGKLDLYLNYWLGGYMNEVTEFCYWNNLMGDPACEVFTGYPADMSVSAPASVPVGSNSVTVTVSDAGGPLAGAQVCLWKGSETYVLGETGADGSAELAVSLPTAGDLLLTVSSHNHRPVLSTIPVAAVPRLVAFQSFTVNDGAPPAQGNGDSNVNPTETIQLPVELRNFGSEAVTGATAVLTTEDPYATILSGTSSVPDLAAGDSAWVATPFTFTVAPGCHHGHTIRFALDVSAGADQWHSIVEVPVVSTDLQFRNYTWYNAGPNGILDPGEVVGVSLMLKNYGGLSAVTPTAMLVSLSEYVSVLTDSVTYPTMAPGQGGEDTSQPFIVSASPACYNGYLASFRLILRSVGGVEDTVAVTLPVGTRAASDPTGPDGYGYMAYDDTDTGYPEHPTYSWIEIDPNLGGNGTEIVLGDNADYQDKTRTVGLPFPFQYYGESYTTASVCSNGWIVMGSTYLTNYRNWTLPSFGGPDGTIAVFWDDIYQRSGSTPPAKCYQKYNDADHTWVVEWDNFTCNYNYSSPETFEAIFYDPAYYPTETGDGMIQFQYKTFNNVDQVDGFCTVGIEKPDNSDGLLYTYFNVYTPGSTTITTGRAIRFVPTREDLTGVRGTSGAPSLSLAVASPMSPGNRVRFSLPRTGETALVVYDVQGRTARTLFHGTLPAGSHDVSWDGRDDAGRPVASGFYFYRLTLAGRSVTGRGLLVR